MMSLRDANIGEQYKVLSVEVNDNDIEAFLFRLGCYDGEPITVISRKRKSCIVSIKGGRYSFDNTLTEAIKVQ